MIVALSALDRKVAVGVLARAALELASEGNPAARPVLPGEETLRASVIKEARSLIGIDEADNDVGAIERLCDYLDDQSDQLLGPADTDAALRRLAERGDLPSDLYEVQIDPNVRSYLGSRFDLERQLIITTIHAPQREQHYGRSKSSREPSLISLFARRFQTKWPFKDFTMLVAAARDGLILIVHQAWRLYDSELNTRNATDLVELLRRFAHKYGSEIEVGSQRGNFFLYSDSVVPDSWKARIESVNGRRRHFNVCQFSQRDTPSDHLKAALIVSIDLTLYLDLLDKMSVKPNEILDVAFHRAPSPRTPE